MSRPSGRKPDQCRDITIQRQFTCHAEGSVLISMGNTKVICTASVETGVPPFLRGKGQGWVTAEYGMLPRSTGSRMSREAARGKQSGRTQEIQRLIGRSLRAVVDLNALGENTIQIDCDVIQAESITGACVALEDAIDTLIAKGAISKSPLKQRVAAISVGMLGDTAVLDLDYAEDSTADTDMNVVMAASGDFIEVQGTAEGECFRREQLNAMLDLAEKGVAELIAAQAAARES